MESPNIPPSVRAAPMRLPQALVLRGPAQPGPEVDWTSWYLTDEDDTGSSFEQQAIIMLFISCLEQLAYERGWTNRLVSTDVFFGWVVGHPLVRVSPDVFVIDDPPDPLPRSIQTWRKGHQPPAFAVEVVSRDPEKDYESAPEKYAQLGCRELLVFEPDGADEGRRFLALYRRATDGAFEEVYVGPGPVRSVQLDAWVVVTRHGGGAVIRLARDEFGSDSIPTTQEMLAIQRDARLAAEARVRDLEEQLRKKST